MTTVGIIIICAGGVSLIIAVVGAVMAWRGEGRLVAIQETPRSTAQDVLAIHRNNGAYAQPCEVAGAIECDTSLSGPLSGQSCIAYSHTLRWEEWGQPTLLDRHHDASGLVYRNGGTELDDRRVPTFWVRDATGRVQVDPTNAELDMLATDANYEVMTASVGGGERRTRREERALPLGPVYVLGYLGERQGQPVIQRHPSGPAKKFLISYRDEEQLTKANSRQASIAYFITGIAGSLGLVLLAWEFVLRHGR